MIFSFNKASTDKDDCNYDSLKIDTINEIEELLSKQSKKIYIINYVDIDNILDSNAEKMFLQNVSSNKKNNNNSSKRNSKSKGHRFKRTLSDYLKNGGYLDYSLDSDSALSKEDQKNKKDDKSKKHKKRYKNFILKSELFSSFENVKKMKSEKASPRPYML